MKDEDLAGLSQVVKMEFERRAREIAKEAEEAGHSFQAIYNITYEQLVKEHFNPDDALTLASYSKEKISITIPPEIKAEQSKIVSRYPDLFQYPDGTLEGELRYQKP